MLDLVLGLTLSAIVAAMAYYKKSLSLSGLFAAIILGCLIYFLCGWLPWSILILFFISSSLLSKFKRQHKLTVEADFAKTGCRDWLQVTANGAVGLLLVLVWWLTEDNLYCIGYLAALATVNADTWATEIGVLSKKAPVSILTLQPTSPGVSGAVSPLGTSAALAGSTFIALPSALGLLLLGWKSSTLLPVIVAVALGGFFGCMVDSLLGATVQAMYRCQVCGKITERNIHHDLPTILFRGLKFFHNDLVNLLSSLLGSLMAMILYFILG